MTVGDNTIYKLRDLVRSGRFRTGDRLPNEQDLSAQLGVSRASLREAVRALSLLRVLDVRHGDGTYVLPVGSDTFVAAASFLADLLSEESVIEAFAARRLIEPLVTAAAATQIGAEQLQALHECMDEMDAATSVEALVDADVRFHRLVNRAGGNVLLASFLEALSSRTVRARVWRGISDRKTLDETRHAHRQILRALDAHDAQLAHATAAMHVADSERWLRAAIQPAADEVDGGRVVRSG